MQTVSGKFVPVMITPFNLKAEIDFDAVSVLIDFYLKAGVKGIFANCLSSEMFSISEAERLQLTRHIVHYVNGRHSCGSVLQTKNGVWCVRIIELKPVGYFF